MGIEATLKRVSPEVLSAVCGHVDGAQVFALMERRALTLRPYMREAQLTESLRKRFEEMDQRSTGLWLLDQGVKDAPARYEPLVRHVPLFKREWEDPALDLYKDWHLLHFLLCSNPDADRNPLSWAVLGRQDLAPGLDDPPITYLEVQDVREVAKALRAADFGALEIAARSAEPKGVYRWHAGEKAWLRPHFDALCQYYATAGENGMAMLMWRS
jgi:hypothetical protein